MNFFSSRGRQRLKVVRLGLGIVEDRFAVPRVSPARQPVAFVVLPVGTVFVGLRARLVCRPASWKLVERDDRVRGTGEAHGDMRKSRACDRQAVKCPAACDREGHSGEPKYTRTLAAVCGVRHVIVRKR